ncbi:MAG: DUF4038 domain-containing protein [Candidatus Brockarchaeota archaeon]|nr:DUF4038 domain-containing protein [Candidatus Brockarchaeota archaeon]
MQGPIKISENGRYFVTAAGKPIFWLATTQWQIFREHPLVEVELILDKAKENGFNFIQAMLLGVGDGTKPNIHGDTPWKKDDPATPNEAYFEHVDAVVQAARRKELILVAGIYHQTMGDRVKMKNARTWARWIAGRYAGAPNLIWSMYPKAEPEYTALLRELAIGLQQGDGGVHLITVHPDPAPATSSTYLHNESWLAFNSIQTWASVDLIYPMVSHDYGLRPAKPVVMAEGAYENGTEYGFEVSPLWIRRQAYYSYLAGAHHSYGHNDSWRMLPTWKEALDAPGAKHLSVLKNILLSLEEWWNLVPDQAILVSGGCTNGRSLNLAARHRDGKWMIAYFADKASFKVDLGKVGGKAEAFWIDPRNGESISIGSLTGDTKYFSTPEGWEDSLLVMKATK